MMRTSLFAVGLGLTLSLAVSAAAPQRSPGPGGFDQGPGGRGGPFAEEIKIARKFDANGDGWLNAGERRAALEYVKAQGVGGGPGGPGGPRGGPSGMGPRGGGTATGSPGAKLSPESVKPLGAAPLYDPGALRTIFLEFEDANWEEQLMAFKATDVEVPATLTVDSRMYKDVGIRFRGLSSFMGVPEGLKHSINLSVDFVHADQRLLGYRTLNLLNSHDDPTFLRSMLFSEIARDYMPAPKANYMRVAINGESWGIYVNVEQFNKDSVKAWYGSSDGARWKVPGNPGGRGGLEYIGEDPAAYKRYYEIKSKDDPKSWADFVTLCRVLNQTPPAQLEAALAPILDVDEALRFLALDNALVNGDGYWIRSSDYSIYQDVRGRFHVIPQDANETFNEGGGPGGRGGRGRPPDFGGFPPPPDRGGFRPPPGGRMGGFMFAGGPEIDPLIGLDDPTKPLRSKLLAVPELREKYLGYVRAIATTWLDWNRIGPLVTRHQALIAAEVKADTRKLNTFESFQSGVEALRQFVEKRRAYLLRTSTPGTRAR